MDNPEITKLAARARRHLYAAGMDSLLSVVDGMESFNTHAQQAVCKVIEESTVRSLQMIIDKCIEAGAIVND
jgi:hypothetical protein